MFSKLEELEDVYKFISHKSAINDQDHYILKRPLLGRIRTIKECYDEEEDYESEMDI